jgi:hypothetical protein
VLFRSPLEFPNPHLFLPQRFLPADFPFPPKSTSTFTSPPAPNTTTPPNPNAQSINPDAYRPFERGPRNCIGQELALLELKVILVLLVRRFSFREAYVELDARRSGGMRGGWFGPGGAKVGSKAPPREGNVGEGVSEKKEVDEWGGRAYLVSLASNKPKEGIPVWVSEESGK